MKELDTEIDGKGDLAGYRLLLVAKTDLGFVYKTTDEFGIVSYEVFERKEQKAQDIIMGGEKVHYDAKVVYPKTSDFGHWAWCFHKEEDALKRLSEFQPKKEKNEKDA